MFYFIWLHSLSYLDHIIYFWSVFNGLLNTFVQVDDQPEEEPEEELNPPPQPKPPQPTPPVDKPKKTKTKESKKKVKKDRIDSAAYSMAVPAKFKGYEVFYDAPDDPDVPVAKGRLIQCTSNSVRWRQRIQQWLYLVIVCLTLFHWHDFLHDWSTTFVSACKYYTYHWFTLLRHCTELNV